MNEISANGLRFAYLEEGRGPLVLLLHGFPDTPHTWDRARPALAAAGFRVVAPFLRGYAPTAIPEDGKYDIETLGRDVLALIAALGEEKAILVGHDWGTAAATAAALLEPARVSFLVTVGVPHPASIRVTPRMVWGARHFVAFQLPGAENRLRAGDFAQVDQLVRRWSPAWDCSPDETAAVKRCFRNPGVVEAALGYYRAVSLSPPPFLREPIAVPSAVFSGGHDAVLRLSDYQRARRWYRAPHEIIHMPGGHFLHREHPERFNAELLRVLR
jgi:pimeloyl-ACP methyl ester carboxylesterase